MIQYTRNHNHNENNAIRALTTSELNAFLYEVEDQLAQEEAKRAEERALAIKEAEEEANRVHECEEEWLYEQETMQFLRRYERALYRLFHTAKKDFTIENMAIVSDILGNYSDIYKDAYDIRPHWFIEATNIRFAKKFPAIWEAYKNMSYDEQDALSQCASPKFWAEWKAKYEN